MPGPQRFSKAAQTKKLGPTFRHLRELLDDPESSITARRDPTALLPETLLVFEVTGPLTNLATALEKIPSLSLVAEDVAEAADEGEEPGFLYLVIPDAAALRNIETLWARWQKGDQLAGMAGIRDLFDCLKSVRRWSAQDRVTDADAASLRLLARDSPDTPIGVEVELVYRDSIKISEEAETEVVAAVLEAGGSVLDRARYREFASHALLVSLPAAEVRRIAERETDTLADLEPIMSIGPQSAISTDIEVDTGTPADLIAGLPERAPIAAIFDAVPDLDHPFLTDRLVLDDPEGMHDRSVGVRFHGTAMASLVLHGDLNAPGPALGRPVYMRPVMYAPTPGQAIEVFPSDKLVVDNFYAAVTRMKAASEARSAAAPSVLVVNVSLGDTRRRFANKLSRWARALDDLAWRYKILFVISAGNLDVPGLDDVPVAAFSTLADFQEATDAERAEAILAGIAASIRDRTLLAPADSVNGLTVGAANLDNAAVGEASVTNTFAAYEGLDTLANVSSAPGPGFNRAVKPEVLFAGGRERVAPVSGRSGLHVRARRPSKIAGLKVAAQSTGTTSGSGNTTFAGQTSSAAALATRTAHRIHDALENAYGDLFSNVDAAHRALILKALIVHRARWSKAEADITKAFGPEEHWQKKKANVARMLGYGIVDPEEAVACAANRATAWGIGRLAPNGAATFRVPLPACLSGQTVPHAVSATVAWFTPTSPGRRSYRQVRVSLVDPPSSDLGRIGVDKQSEQPDVAASKRGTVAHRRYAGKRAAALITNDAIEIMVQRENDIGGILNDLVPFAIAVSIEAEADIPIYDEVAVRLTVQPAVQVPAASVVVDVQT